MSAIDWIRMQIQQAQQTIQPYLQRPPLPVSQTYTERTVDVMRRHEAVSQQIETTARERLGSGYLGGVAAGITKTIVGIPYGVVIGIGAGAAIITDPQIRAQIRAKPMETLTAMRTGVIGIVTEPIHQISSGDPYAVGAGLGTVAVLLAPVKGFRGAKVSKFIMKEGRLKPLEIKPDFIPHPTAITVIEKATKPIPKIPKPEIIVIKEKFQITPPKPDFIPHPTAITVTGKSMIKTIERESQFRHKPGVISSVKGFVKSKEASVSMMQPELMMQRKPAMSTQTHVILSPKTIGEIKTMGQLKEALFHPISRGGSGSAAATIYLKGAAPRSYIPVGMLGRTEYQPIGTITKPITRFKVAEMDYDIMGSKVIERITEQMMEPRSALRSLTTIQRLGTITPVRPFQEMGLKSDLRTDLRTDTREVTRFVFDTPAVLIPAMAVITKTRIKIPVKEIIRIKEIAKFKPPGKRKLKVPKSGKEDYIVLDEKPKSIMKESKKGKDKPWFPASLEAVTLEESKTGKRAIHIREQKTSQKLFRRFLRTGKGIPTAAQFKNKKVKL